MTVPCEVVELERMSDYGGGRRQRCQIRENVGLQRCRIREDSLNYVYLHFVGSDLAYTAGDAIGIIPVNNPPEVDLLLAALHCTGKEKVPIPNSAYEPKPKTPK